MDKRADLHIHTHFSDSTSSPQEVVDQALADGLTCIAITDHDVFGGVQPAKDYGAQKGLEVLSGIELSAEADGKDVHMLGYCVDYQAGAIVEKLGEIQRMRVERMGNSIDILKKFGIKDITLEEVCAKTKSNAVGRPHLATVLLEKGHVSTMQEAFDKYLAEGQPACVAKYRMSPIEAVELVHAAGGVSIMAHPMITKKDELIPSLIEAGLDGIEVYYPNTQPDITNGYIAIAKKHNLLITGGSDAHGDAKKHTWVGKAYIDYEHVERLKERVAKR